MSATFFFLPLLDLLYRGVNFEAFGISAFDNLCKFTFSKKGEESEKFVTCSIGINAP